MTDYPARLLARVVEPASEPVTLAEAKLYLRVDGTSEDTLIADLITSARIAAEDYLNRSLITQSWKLAYNGCAAEQVRLPRGPVIAISSVTAIDRAGAPTVINGSTYYIDASREMLVFDSAVLAHRVEIVYSAGYGDAAAVPRPIKYAILAHVAALYERRGEGEDRLPPQSIGLLAPFREVRV